MPLTSPELVKKHLSAMRLGSIMVTDHPATLNGTAQQQLPHGGLKSGTVAVKAQRQNDPVREDISLGSDGVNLSHLYIVPGSVLVAADRSLSVIYTENLDYSVDVVAGRIARIPDGDISEGQNVSVWYQYGHVYEENVDYSVDLDAGRISRKAGGAIAAGQNVTIDYEASGLDVADSSIELAIDEAAQEIARRIEQSWYDTPDSGLIAAETHWAVSLVARILAAASLSATGIDATSRRATADGWLELADRYAATALDSLKPYSLSRSDHHRLGIAGRS